MKDTPQGTSFHSDWTVEWLPPETAVQSVLRGQSGMSQIHNGHSENVHIRVTAAPLHQRTHTHVLYVGFI